MILCKIPDHEKSATPIDKLNNTKSPMIMRLAVLINHGGMAARRYFEPKVWLSLPCQFDTGKEALGLGLARARCENNDIISIGLKMSSDNGSNNCLRCVQLLAQRPSRAIIQQ